LGATFVSAARSSSSLVLLLLSIHGVGFVIFFLDLVIPFLHLQDLARKHLIPGEALLHLQDLALGHLIPAKALILFRLTNKS